MFVLAAVLERQSVVVAVVDVAVVEVTAAEN